MDKRQEAVGKIEHKRNSGLHYARVNRPGWPDTVFTDYFESIAYTKAEADRLAADEGWKIVRWES